MEGLLVISPHHLRFVARPLLNTACALLSQAPGRGVLLVCHDSAGEPLAAPGEQQAELEGEEAEEREDGEQGVREHVHVPLMQRAL